MNIKLLNKRKRREEFEKSLKISRRQLLLGGSALAGSAAMVAASLKTSSAYALGPQGVSPHYPDSSGGAALKYIDHGSDHLGTSEIVGPIARVSEATTGFSRAMSGELGEDMRRRVTTFITKHPVGDALNFYCSILGEERAVDGIPSEEKLPIPDPERMTSHIKSLARFLRADEVGVGLFPMHSAYTERYTRAVTNPVTGFPGDTVPYEFNPNHKYVITVLVDQDLRTLLASTGYDGISGAQSFRSYTTTALISCIIARYIRRLGYSARAHHARNYGAALPPSIIASGLGEHSRAADCVIHPRLGFRHKAAIITTDMPLLPDKAIDFGLKDFCRHCKKCADNCPAKAISHETEQDVFNGYKRWSGDFTKCTEFRVGNQEGSSCGRCMKVCPWNNKEDSWFHTASVYASSKTSIASILLRDMDDIFGYGTEQLEQYKWWLEWEDLY